MKQKRRYLTAEFKARVAAEALKGEQRIMQISQ
jgi:transposase-like protein